MALEKGSSGEVDGRAVADECLLDLRFAGQRWSKVAGV